MMKKIIAIFDGLKFSESTMHYAVAVAKITNTNLVGVFLDDMTYTSYKIYELIAEEGVSEKKMQALDKKDQDTRAAAVAQFEKVCKTAKVQFSIHRDKNIAIKEVLHESIYADLLIIDRKETFTHHDEQIPTWFIRDLLTDVQCPVLLVPKKYKKMQQAIMLYDGEPSAVHAIKMISYLQLVNTEIDVEILSVQQGKKGLQLPDAKLMKEFTRYHFPKAAYKILKGMPEIEIVKYLKQQDKTAVVVLGAYRRGAVSRWFKASMADELMIELGNPLFIAHNK